MALLSEREVALVQRTVRLVDALERVAEGAHCRRCRAIAARALRPTSRPDPFLVAALVGFALTFVGLLKVWL